VFLSQLIAQNKKFKFDNDFLMTTISPYYPDESLQLIPEKEKNPLQASYSISQFGVPDSEPLSKLLYNNLQSNRSVVRTVVGRNRDSVSSTMQGLKFEIDKHAIWGGRRWIFDGMALKSNPQNHFYTPNNPFVYSQSWPYFSSLVEYAQTISKLLDGVAQVKHALMIYPRATLYNAYNLSGRGEYCRTLSAMEECGTLCTKLQIGYDVVDENELLGGKTGKNTLLLSANGGKKSYTAVILPRISILSRRTIDLLEQLAKKDINVFWMGNLPTMTLEQGALPAVRQQLEQSIKKLPAMKYFETIATAEQDLQHACPVPIRIRSASRPVDDICVLQTEGNHTCFLLYNRSEETDRHVDIFLETNKKLFLGDIDNEELYKFPKIQQVEKGYQFDLNFQPRQLYLFVCSNQNLPSGKGHLIETQLGLDRKYRIVFKDKWTFKPDQLNVLPLTYWNMRLGGSKENNGFFRFYETYLEAEDVPDQLKFRLSSIVNRPIEAHGPYYKHVEIAVNGIKIKDFQPRSIYGETLWEKENAAKQQDEDLEVDIAANIHKGYNRITVRSIGNHYAPQSIKYPPLILGNFILRRGSRGWILSKKVGELGYASWADNGFPYLSGSGIYSQVFERPNDFKKLIIKFRKVEEIAILRINNQPISTFLYEPMEVDVTNFILQGRNEISIQVFNTIDNVTKMNYRPSGLVGEVFLDVY
jgi:hypothetical protein